LGKAAIPANTKADTAWDVSFKSRAAPLVCAAQHQLTAARGQPVGWGEGVSGSGNGPPPCGGGGCAGGSLQSTEMVRRAGTEIVRRAGTMLAHRLGKLKGGY
jgi:hypothetical protein